MPKSCSEWAKSISDDGAFGYRNQRRSHYGYDKMVGGLVDVYEYIGDTDTLYDHTSVEFYSSKTYFIHNTVDGAWINPDNGNTNMGKAGRNRWYGNRPKVRGVAMNPIDHPHGGGEGRTSGGRHPVTPWGKPTKGKRTRSNKTTDKFIMRSRHQRKK